MFPRNTTQTDTTQTLLRALTHRQTPTKPSELLALPPFDPSAEGTRTQSTALGFTRRARTINTTATNDVTAPP